MCRVDKVEINGADIILFGHDGQFGRSPQQAVLNQRHVHVYIVMQNVQRIALGVVVNGLGGCCPVLQRFGVLAVVLRCKLQGEEKQDGECRLNFHIETLKTDYKCGFFVSSMQRAFIFYFSTMIYKLLSTIGMLAFVLTGFAQSEVHTLGSVSAMPDDSVKVKAWLSLSETEGKGSYALAEAYADSAAQLAYRIGYLKGWATALNKLGQAAMKQSKYDLAMSSYEKAFRYYDSVGLDRNKARILNNMSFVKRDQADYEQAIQLLFDALAIYEDLNDTSGIANAYTNIAVAHAIKRDLDFAEEYFVKAKELFEAVDMQRNVHTIVLNLAGIKMEREKYDEAIPMLQEALAYFEANGPLTEEARTYYILGNIYLFTNQLDLSEKNYWHAKTIFDSIGNPMRSYGCLLRMSSVAEKRGDLDQAIDYAKDVLVQNDAAGLKNMSLRSTAQLASLYEQKKDYKTALEYQKMNMNWRDSIYNEEKDAQIAELVERYESEKSKQELKEAKAQIELQELKVRRQKVQQRILIGVSVSVLLILILVFLQLRTRKKNNAILREKNAIINESLQEKEILLKEIHHRVKNNLQFISSLMNLQARHVSDPKTLSVLNEGKSRVQSMALVHQKLYQEENLKGVDMRDYIKTLMDNLVHSYDVTDRIAITQNVADLVLDIDSAMPIGMIVNELVINAFKYAFHEGQSGEVRISLTPNEDKLNLTIEDNGVGLPAEFSVDKSEQFGLNLVQSLAQKLKAKIDINSDQGTRIVLTIHQFKTA